MDLYTPFQFLYPPLFTPPPPTGAIPVYSYQNHFNIDTIISLAPFLTGTIPAQSLAATPVIPPETQFQPQLYPWRHSGTLHQKPTLHTEHLIGGENIRLLQGMSQLNPRRE